jgi:ribonucleoside-triphosphate reductase
MTAKYGIPYFSNFINSDMKPEDARSMCLHGDEEIIIRNKGKIERTTMKEIIETYGGEEWSDCNEELEVLGLDNEYKIEWTKIKSFFMTKLKGMVKIKTKDGKFAGYSENHPVLILTEGGLKQKMAKEIEIGDYMISLKDASKMLSKEKEKIGNFEFDEKLAFLLGFFTADGNFLYKSKTKKLRGLQFTFDSRNIGLIETIKTLIKEKFNYDAKEKKDSRYNTYYLYAYHSDIANLLFNHGFKKYGKLPNILFNSPKEVVEEFLLGFFTGDGYEKRKEIHIKDSLLIRDLAMLYSLIGVPNIIKIREKSQRLYLQHKTKEDNIKNQPVNCLFDLIPGFLAKSTYVVPGLNKGRMVGQATLMKYHAETALSIKLKNSDIYPVEVSEIEKFDNIEDFYDIELEKNHKFVHSLGTITNNCCRLRLDNRELRKRGGGLFGANPLTGSIGVVTINLPRIGYLAQSEDEFLRRLGYMMDLAMESLEIKRKIVEKFTELGLYPYAKHFLLGIKQRFGDYWKNHFSTIGIIGMNEAMLNFLGFGLDNKDAQEFALRILDFMRDRIAYYQDMTGHLYNLEATPGEGTSYSLARKDKKLYPAIKVANEEDVIGKKAAPYYTNSSQLPVNMTDDIFEALDIQDNFQTKYTGGTVLHGFIGEKLPSIEAVKILVKKIAYNYKLPYFTLTPTFSVCPIHGYIAGEHEYCPKCDEIPEDKLQEVLQKNVEEKKEEVK